MLEQAEITNHIRRLRFENGEMTQDDLAKRAGVTGPHGSHSFRHAFAIACLMNGCDLASLSQILGHSSVAVTADVYGRFVTKQLQEMHERHSPLAQILGGDEDDDERDS